MKPLLFKEKKVYRF